MMQKILQKRNGKKRQNQMVASGQPGPKQSGSLYS